MRPRPPLAARLALLGASLLLVFGVAEVAFRLLGYTSIYSVYSKPSLFWVHDPQLGWSHQPGAEGIYLGPRPFPIEFEAPVEINSLGVRGPEIGPKQPGELRLLFLGDSVVAGFEVANDETFVAILEQTLARRLRRPVRAINAGVRGYGTDQSLIYYRERGRKLDADVVLLVHSDNDPNDNVTIHKARRPFGKPAFALAPDGGLDVVGQPVPTFPLCSAWMLGASGEPIDIDSFGTRLACFLQTRLADHSATFGVLARTVARFPNATIFLKNLTQPAEQREHRGENPGAGLARPAPRFAGLPGVSVASAAAPVAAHFQLTTSLILGLAESVRADGAEFRLLLTRAGDMGQIDLEQIERAGIDARLMTTQLPPQLLQWKNDGHLNVQGHRHVADLLANSLAPELRKIARERSGPPPGAAPRPPQSDGAKP